METNGRRKRKRRGSPRFAEWPGRAGISVPAMVWLCLLLILPSDAAGLLTLRKTGPDRAPVFVASHPLPAPMEVEFQLVQGAAETVSDPPMPARIVVPPGPASEVFRLRPLGETGAWSYRYQYRFVMGDPAARHAPERPYRPPIPAGERFRLAGMGEGGEVHAATILMPPGTPVVCARAGRVVEAGERAFQRRIGRRTLEGTTAFVRLIHADGTFGVYAHLARDGVAVRPGARVERGEVLGRVGREIEPPSLVFMVQRNAGMRLESVPFRFEGPDGGAVEPMRGMILTAR